MDELTRFGNRTASSLTVVCSLPMIAVAVCRTNFGELKTLSLLLQMTVG